MKVTFEIEIEDGVLDKLDYYENFGEMGSKEAGCNKCVFRPMCSIWIDIESKHVSPKDSEIKFPCWDNRHDHFHGTNRHVFVSHSEPEEQ